ncbi:type II toxin-antitoxin system RelE/ParE family toxin [Williamwhitmania taraxaci]|uniref:type II toxin-antitoxin system RelE/ParE family toxin n=1 Tax=Williamwhitmania taraxaci TaxID=1640674 RepID=UPI000B809DDB
MIEYLLGEWGENVTKAFVKRTFEFLDLLIDFPEIGSVENEDRQIRGFVLIKQLTIFYKIKGDTIVFLNFYDNRQSPKRRHYARHAR